MRTMNIAQNAIHNMVVLFMLYIIGCILDVLPIGQVFLLRDTPSIYYLIMGILVTWYFSRRIIDRDLRFCLIGIGIMITFWFFLRVEKFVAFEENEWMVRKLWYCYYIPRLAISQLSFWAALFVDQTHHKKDIHLVCFTSVITVLLMALVLTNDSHQFVFMFQENFVNFVDEYTYGTGYYCVVVWEYLLLLASIIILFCKCTLKHSKKLMWILVAYVVVFAFLLVLLLFNIRLVVLGKNFGEVAETECFLMGGIWILCINLGLIPSNKGYGQFLQNTKLAMQITDRDYSSVYQSNDFLPMMSEQLNSEESVSVNEDVICYRKEVPGGYSYWQADYSKLNAIKEELKNISETLEEESEMIRLENELKERNAHIEAKSQVYDEIATKVLRQSHEIEELSKQISEHPELFEKNMRKVCVYAAYIKRMSNLMLIKSQKTIELGELYFAIEESLRYLQKIPVIVELGDYRNVDLQRQVPCDYLLSAYETFENVIEQDLPALKAVMVTMQDDCIKLTLEGVVISQTKGIQVEVDEDTSFVKIPLRKDGE